MQYLNRHRLEKTGELLVNFSLGVKEITVKVGMGDVIHFLRDFKKIYE